MSERRPEDEGSEEGEEYEDEGDLEELGESEGEVDDAGDDDGNDEGEDEEEEEDEEEPKLKYMRLGSSVVTILKSDKATCLVAHEKFLVMGTQTGRLHVLDVTGNEIMRLEVHSGPVTDLSMDSTGDFVASCSTDGTVVITNLFDRQTTKYNYHRPVTAVALPANYKQSTMFATGGLTQQFIINTKGWFSNKDNVIHAGEGPIHAIAWRGDLIAWANNLGVKVYDCATSERITYISRSQGAPPPDQYRCCLHWAKDDTLLIGWADSVKIAVVKEKKAQGGPGGVAPSQVKSGGIIPTAR